MKSTKIIDVSLITYVYMFLILFSGYKNILLRVLLIFTIHELGHILIAKFFKIKIIKIKIYPFGGIIDFNKKINIYLYIDFFIAIGGLLFQIVLLIINAIFIKDILLNYYNLLIIYINLLPVTPLDGSKIIFIIFNRFFSYFKSLIIVIVLSIVCLIVVCIYMHLRGNINIIFLMFIVWSIISDIFDMKKKMTTFFIERYVEVFKFKRKKKFKKINLNLLKREELGYFYENMWHNEKYFLAKRFDIRTYF